MIQKTKRLFGRLLREEDGPTTTEYAILLALIILICFLSIQSVGSPVKGMWENSGTDMNSALNDQN